MNLNYMRGDYSMGTQLRETGKTTICGKEYTIEELRKGIKNPFYDKLIKEVLVPVKLEDYAIFEEVAKMNGETPELTMKRCLSMAAKRMQEHD